MRYATVFILLAWFVSGAGAGTDDLSGAPTAKTPPRGDRAVVPTTRPISEVGDTIKGLRIEVALFGSGTHLADVTDRVLVLLRTEPDGFTARAQTLQVDPVPGKNKSLLIRYRYHDQERLYMITGGNRASYALLMEDADK